MTGDLPFDRLTRNGPVAISGTDFAGPFYIRDGKLRNRKITKAHMCIFVCFSTRASHIVLVSYMTTPAFLNSLKRFISRRGICKVIYWNNGINYMGAYNHIKDIQDFLRNANSNSLVLRFCQENRISWRFKPSLSPIKAEYERRLLNQPSITQPELWGKPT